MIGDIFCEEAYALGKMLDHSSWAIGEKVLPRGITPSDFDLVFDNNGCVLFCELSSGASEWGEVSTGQCLTYKAAIRKGVHCAVLCTHDVKVEYGRKIDTREDIISFQVMTFGWGSFWVSRVVEGSAWPNFVFAWYRNPDGLRGHVLERSVML